MKYMRIAMQDLKLEVYPGKSGYLMDENIECVSLAELERVRESPQ